MSDSEKTFEKSKIYLSRQSPAAANSQVVKRLRANDRFRRRCEEILNQWTLTWPHYDTLLVLRNHEYVPTISELSEWIWGTKDSDVWRLVKLLAEKGYVERRDDPADGRKKRVHLTEEGIEAVREATLALEREGFETTSMEPVRA